jgi:hypothetical protein
MLLPVLHNRQVPFASKPELNYAAQLAFSRCRRKSQNENLIYPLPNVLNIQLFQKLLTISTTDYSDDYRRHRRR